MAFQFKNSRGVGYYLHSKDVNLKGGRKQTIYYFARDIRPGALDAVPPATRSWKRPRPGCPS
jgi:hypothetical protein